MLRFQVQELQEASLKKGEWAELKETRKLSASAEKRAQLALQLNTAINGNTEEESGAREKLETALSGWRELARLDPSLSDGLDRLEAAVSEIQDISLVLADYSHKLEYDPAQLDRDEARLAKLETLSRKYGGSEESMLEFLDRAETEMAGLENHEHERLRLEKMEVEARNTWAAAAGTLSRARGKASKKLSKAIVAGLADLGMDKAVFEVRVSSPGTIESIDQAAGPDGFDEVAFMLSANPGQPAKALALSASGGEISRVMLAIKTVLVDVDPVDTLVFDEIDQGVSGRVADAVGEKLSQLSSRRQVFVITHLPQVASRPAMHLNVAKESKSGQTITSVFPLSDDDRIQEIASLIDGKNLTSSGLEHARHLLAGAQQHD